MALSDKDILITPNRGQTAEPKIEFKGASNVLGPQTITLNVYPTNNGTVSFEGSAGQLFSITNDLSGTIYSVNDVSGIPSIEVLDTGLVKLAEYSGNVQIGKDILITPGTTTTNKEISITNGTATGNTTKLSFINGNTTSDTNASDYILEFGKGASSNYTNLLAKNKKGINVITELKNNDGAFLEHTVKWENGTADVNGEKSLYVYDFPYVEEYWRANDTLANQSSLGIIVDAYRNPKIRAFSSGGLDTTNRGLTLEASSRKFIFCTDGGIALGVSGSETKGTSGQAILSGGAGAAAAWGNVVLPTRSISTTAPLTGGGDFSANRTFALASGYGDTQNPYASKTANFVLAAPEGAAGVPTFRALVAADIPSIDTSKITTGTLAVARGGTGTTTSTGSGSVVLSTSPTLTTPNIGVATGTSFNSITGLASVAPLIAGTAAVGTSTLAARQDHVHPEQTTVSGNAGTATTLATARNINGVSFNGSANINVPNLQGTNGTVTFASTGVTSGVNYLSTTNSITGAAVSLTTAGSDTNIGLDITTKGTGAIIIDTGTGAGQIDLKPGSANVRLWDDNSSHYYQFVTGDRTANYNITLPAGNVTLTAGTTVVTDATNQDVAGTKVFTAGLFANNQAVIRGGGVSAEGAQIVMGYGNNVATTITGQSNNTWNIDVAAGAAFNDFRIFRQNSAGASQVVLQANESTGEVSLSGSPGSESLRTTRVTNQVNYFTVSGQITANAPGIAATGSDSNIGFNLSTKGSGGYSFLTNAYNQTQFRVLHTGSAVNYLQVTGSATGAAPVLSAAGSDTNIDITITPKGTGVVSTAAPVEVAGGISISGGPGTIGGATFNNGWLRIGTSTTGWAFDNNEFYTAGNCLIGSLAGSTMSFTNIPAFTGGTSGSTAPFTVDSTTVVTNLNADLLDGIDSAAFLRSDVGDTWSATNAPLTITTPAGAVGSNTGAVNTLQVFQATGGSDAFMTFHVSGDHANHFGIDGTTNDLFVGGWSSGAVKNKVWHAGNDGAGSGLDADLLDGKNIGTSGNTVPLLDGTNTWSGVQTFSNGIRNGVNMTYPTWEGILDFGSDVANTWKKIIGASLSNVQYSTIGFKIDIIDPNANHATQGAVNPEEESYYVVCVRAEATTLDSPDLCVVRGPGNRIRAIKTAVGVYEVQIQNETQYREYYVRITPYSFNGSHTITYFALGTAGTATATYNASTGTSINYFSNITSTGNLHVTLGDTSSARFTRNASQYYEIIGSAAPSFTSYSATNNAKTFTLNSTTDISNTAPTSGAVGFNFGVLGVNKLNISTTSAAFTDLVSAPTFNATSVTEGGFQGISSDTAAAPSFTWTGALTDGMWRAGTNTIGFTTNGVNRLSISTTAATSTLPIYVPAGSVTAPSLAFSDDTNTGIYRSGTDQLAITTGGTQAAYFDASGNTNIVGNLGVKSATPSSSAAINSSIDFTTNATRYGILNLVTTTPETLTADRNLHADFNRIYSYHQNSLAFNKTIFGAYNQATALRSTLNLGAGNSVDGEGNIYGAYNLASFTTSDDTFNRMEGIYGSYNYALVSGGTVSLSVATTASSTTATINGSGQTTAMIRVGDFITNNSAIPAGATVATIVDSTTFTLSVAATITQTDTSTSFTYGTSYGDNVYGVRSDVAASYTGTTINNAFGYYSLLRPTATGATINNGYMFYGTNSTVTGTFTNRWGVYIASAIKNYFAGDIQIGGTPATGGTSGAGLGVGVASSGTAGTIVTSSNVTVGGSLVVNGTTQTAGHFYAGTTTPTGTTRINYSGYFYPTFINLSGSGDTATAATHYFVETGSDGFVRPKTLANVKAEILGNTNVTFAGPTAARTYTLPDSSVTLAATTQTFFLGTTSIAINRTSGAIALTGITSIDGSAASATNATNVAITNDTSSTGTHYVHIGDATSGNDGVKVSSTKLTFQPSTGNLTVGGTVTANSDAKLKTDLVQIPDALNKVHSLTGYTYTRIDTGERQTGLIAQDVQKVLPEAVIEGDVLSLAYGNLVGLLVEAIKEQQTEIDELKSMVKQLMEKLK